MQTSSLALILVVAISSTVSAAGIKGLAQQQQADSGNLQRLDATKGPRQQFRPISPAQPIISQQQAPLQAQLTRVGPGSAAPIFSSKRPITQAPLPTPPAPVIIQQQQQPEPEITQQQQQVQEPSEIDPNAASAEAGAAILAPASEEEANPKPEPYAFAYNFAAGDAVSSGSSSREEQQDASGRVTGFYTLKGQDGRDRRVDYVADANGFRATINTNELGTAPKDPADTHIEAQEPSDGQLRSAESATQAARQRAALEASTSQQQQHHQQQQQAERIPAASLGSQSKLNSPRSKQQAPRQQQQQLQQLQQQRQQPTQQVRQEAESAEQAAIAQQLQEPIEQIRQTELNTRARKSRQAPFYLFTVA